MAETTPLRANKAVTAWARLAGDMISDTTPTAVGGSVPPARPVSTLSANSTSILGAKADASTDTESTSRPIRATGRRPKESDNGPTANRETAQAAKVAVAN